MRTPLSRVRGLGSARSGTRDFWLQRLTSIASVPLTIYFVFVVATLAGRSHATVSATLGDPVVAILLLAAILSIVIHMRIGMQVIIEDYVHAPLAKTALLMANTGFTIALGTAGAFAVLAISFAS